ncbi:MAG: hypothetical protein JAZ17_09515 [Candidatus Thiodiazotropha endolucinida]|nr:hypothetical protein [Candidatus Thiodiazotropha endolucinida]
MKQVDFVLDKNHEGMGPFFIGSYKPGDIVGPPIVKAGDNAQLKCDGIVVLADVTHVEENNYKGKIIGFENYLKEELYGKHVGDDIEFKRENIFGVTR